MKLCAKCGLTQSQHEYIGKNNSVCEKPSFTTDKKGYTKSRAFKEGYDMGYTHAKTETSHNQNCTNQESYSNVWLHGTIHLNPKTKEIHIDGDHSIRDYLKFKTSDKEDNA